MTTIFAPVLFAGIAISGSLVYLLAGHLRRQKKVEKLFAAFDDVAAWFNFFSSKKVVLGNRIIGLDEKNNKLLFFGATKDTHDGYLIDLREVEKISIKKEFSLLSNNPRNRPNWENFVNIIILQLDYKNGARPLALPFYDKTKDPVAEMRHRAGKADEWQALLSGRVENEYVIGSNWALRP